MPVGVIVAGTLALLLSLVLLYSYLTSPPRHTRARGRDRRRGGYLKPPASPRLNPGMTRVLLVPGTTDYFSSPSVPGGVSEAWETPRLLREPSRLTGRGWSTVGTEALGANGVPLRGVAWLDDYEKRHGGMDAVAEHWNTHRGPSTSLSPYVWP